MYMCEFCLFLGFNSVIFVFLLEGFNGVFYMWFILWNLMLKCLILVWLGSCCDGEEWFWKEYFCQGWFFVFSVNDHYLPLRVG